MLASGGASPSFSVLRFLPIKDVFQPLPVRRRLVWAAMVLSAVTIMELPHVRLLGITLPGNAPRRQWPEGLAGGIGRRDCTVASDVEAPGRRFCPLTTISA